MPLNARLTARSAARRAQIVIQALIAEPFDFAGALVAINEHFPKVHLLFRARPLSPLDASY